MDTTANTSNVCNFAAVLCSLIMSTSSLGATIQPGPSLDSRAGPPHSEHVRLYLADPIVRQDIERYAELLDLDDEQRQIAFASFNDYRTEYENLRQPELAKLWDMSVETMALDHADTIREFVKAYEQLLNDRKRIVAIMNRLEEALFGAIAQTLSQAQEILLSRVRLERDRRKFPIIGNVPGANVDLVDLVQRCDLEDDERIALDGLLVEYLWEIVPLREDIVNEIVRSGFKEARLHLRFTYDENGNRIEHNSPAEIESRPARFKAMRDVRRRKIRLMNNLRRHNEKGLSNLASGLPPTRATELQALFRNTVYPQIYPDPQSQEPVFARVRLIPSLQDEQRIGLELLELTHRIKYNVVAKKLEQHAYEFVRDTDAGEGVDYQGYLDRMAEYLEERAAIHTETSRLLLEILSCEQLTWLKQNIPTGLDSSSAGLSNR